MKTRYLLSVGLLGGLCLLSIHQPARAITIDGGTYTLTPPTTVLPGIGGLIVHLDATQIAQTDGSNVATWNNLATEGAVGNFGVTGGTQPTFHSEGNLLNGLPVVKFNNSATLRNTTNFGNTATVMFAGRMDGGQNRRLVGGVANNWLMGYHGGGHDKAHFNAWLHNPANVMDYTTRIYEAVLNGGTASFYHNGTLLAGPTGGFQGPNGLELGSGGYNETSFGSIGEVLVFNRALSDTERVQMEQYLQAKWYGPLPSTTAVTITGGGVLDLDGVHQTIGSLAGDATGQVRLGGGWLTVGNANADTTYSGVIADGGAPGGGLAKTGNGILTLAGNQSNTYTGPTVLQAGRLHLAKTGGAYAISGDFIGVNNPSPVVYTTQDNQFAPGAVMYFQNFQGDHVRFELMGTTQTLGGIDNTGAGNRGVIQHRERIGAGLAVGTHSTLVLDVAAGGDYYFAGYLRAQNDTLSFVKDGLGTQTLAGGNINYNGTTSVTGGTLQLTDTTGFRSSTTIGSSGTLEMKVTAGTLTVPGAYSIGGNGTLVKSGVGKWTIGASGREVKINMSGGLVDIQEGIIQNDHVRNAWANNKASVNIAAGAMLDMFSEDVPVDALTGGGVVQNSYAPNGMKTLTVGVNNGSGTFSGTILGTGGNIALTKIGSGSQTLSGSSANTYTGLTTVNGTGTYASPNFLVLSKSADVAAIGGNVRMVNDDANVLYTTANNQFAAGSVLTMSGGAGSHARFELMGTTQTLAGVSNEGTGRGVIQNRELAPANSGASTLVLNGGGTYSFNGYVRNWNGTLSLAKSGSGTQILTGPNITYSGQTTVSGGTLKLTDTGAFNSSIANSATVELHATSGDSLTIQNNKTLSGAGTWIKTGAGRATFANTTLTTTGQFLIQEGTLRNNNNASNWSASTADIDITAGAILDLYADPIYVDQITGNGFVQNNYGNASGYSGGAQFIEKLVVGVANGSSTFDGVIRNNSAGTAPGSGTNGGGVQLEKEGTGTLTLTGANTYTGATTVNAGTLLVNGSLANTAVAVNSGATLGGTGTIAGTVTINAGGTHAPGASVGSQTVGGETWMPGGRFEFEINDAEGQPGGPIGWDQLLVNGTLNLANLTPQDPFYIDIVSLAGAAPGNIDNFAATEPVEWPFLQYETLAGEFNADLFSLDSSAFSNPTGPGYFQILQTQYNGGDWLAIGYVPEPGTWLLLLSALACGLLVRRR